MPQPAVELRERRTRRFRKTIILVHRWTGLTLGLYVFVIGLTGSVLVFEPELQALSTPAFFAAPKSGQPTADPGLVLQNVERAYPGHRVTSINWPTPQRNSFVSYPSRAGVTRTVFLHPDSGEPLGELPEDGFVQRVRQLHVYLLAGRTGLRVSGVAAGGVALMGVSGLVLWWTGTTGFRRGLVVDLTRGWQRGSDTIHRAVGFWTSALLLLWAISGIYLSFPQGFRQVVAAVLPTVGRPQVPQSDPERQRVTFAPAPNPARLVAQAVAVVPGSQPARYSIASTERDPVVVLVALDVVGDRVTTDEVSVYFDQYSGKLLEIRPPATQWGDVLVAWLFPLHAGRFAGMGVRVMWSVLALSLPMLFATGAILWWTRQRVRWGRG